MFTKKKNHEIDQQSACPEWMLEKGMFMADCTELSAKPEQSWEHELNPSITARNFKSS